MTYRHAGLVLGLALASALPAWAQSYPSPTFQALTIQADPSTATQAARKGYVDTGLGARILSSTLGQANGPAQLGSGGVLPIAQIPVGTGAGTVAAGDDGRITGALSTSSAAATYAPLVSPRFTGTGTQINANAGVLPAAPAGTVLQIGGADAAIARFTLDAFGSSPNFTGRRANGTVNAPSALTLDNNIFQFSAFGYGSTGYSGAARATLAINAGGPWTDASQPTYFAVSTTDIGAATVTERLRVQPSGNVTIGKQSDDGVNRLQVNGSAVFSTPLGIASGGTGQTTAAAALSALGGAPLASPTFTGVVAIGSPPVNDNAVPVQINSAGNGPAYFGANRAGGYGTLFGYDPGFGGGVIRQITTDALSFLVNNTVPSLALTSDANARFFGIATAATLRVGTTAGPTWTTGTGAPTSTQPLGSIYSRTDGTYGSTFYFSHGGGTWTAAMGL